jgi:hypothetical protein
VGQHRSTERYEPKPADDDDAALRAELRAFSVDRPRWGYRRAHHHLRQEGWAVNRKRVQRVWREEDSGSPNRDASAGGWGIQQPQRGRCVRSGRGTYGPSISSSIRQSMGGR